MIQLLTVAGLLALSAWFPTPQSPGAAAKFPAAHEVPRDEQIAIAISAAPPAVAEHASVWIVKPSGGYQLARTGTNGFGCLIQSNRFPRCDDAEGVATAFQIIFAAEELRAGGKTRAEIASSIAEGYRTGRFRAPKPGSLSYMLSCHPRSLVRPHIMYASPYATQQSLGMGAGDDAQMKELSAKAGLAILGAGAPDAYVVVYIPNWCEAQKAGA